MSAPLGGAEHERPSSSRAEGSAQGDADDEERQAKRGHTGGPRPALRGRPLLRALRRGEEVE